MPELSRQDDTAIRALFQMLSDAWARGDGEAFASAFAVDADFVNMMAQALRGRSEIARHHAQIFATVYRGTTLRTIDIRIRPIRPDVATIETTAAVDGLDQERRAHALAVAVRSADGWRIQAFHNMIPFVPPRP